MSRKEKIDFYLGKLMNRKAIKVKNKNLVYFSSFFTIFVDN